MAIISGAIKLSNSIITSTYDNLRKDFKRRSKESSDGMDLSATQKKQLTVVLDAESTILQTSQNCMRKSTSFLERRISL